MFWVIASVLASSFVAHANETKESVQNTVDFKAMQYSGQYVVERVIDPLTLQLQDGRTVRMGGLDIPDFNPYKPGSFTRTAIAILKDHLEGQTITLYQSKKSDHHVNRMGQLVGHIIRKDDGQWSQGLLLSLGLARVRTTTTTPDMAYAMYAHEDRARQDKIGIWALENYAVLPADKPDAFMEGYQIVQGQVRGVARRTTNVYMNFGNNWRKDFTVQIKPQSLREFRRKNMDPFTMNGKTIRVRGWVSFYNGPYIEIDHPEAFEIVDP